MFGVILFILYAILLGVLVVGTWRLRFAYKHFRMRQSLSPADAKHEAPSVTVCIPARNEGHALTDCLERVIASTYEKLEIIVLDDLSADKTPTLIKSFASEGVRFVEGKALPSGWLGKNHALQELLEEASGSYVVFMDADTRIAPHSIEQLVAYAQKEDALMVSVLPRREDGWRSSVIFSTLRYFWEVMFHRKESPATASSAWMIHRKTLVDTWNGFSEFKSAIQPESKFSSTFMASGRYRFLIGTPELGIGYEKKWQSQVDTSIRLLYPLLGSRLAHTLVALLDMLIVASPLFIVLGGFIFGWGYHQVAAGVFWVLFAGLYGSYLRLVWKRAWWLAALLWPFIVLQEIVVLVLSAERYRRKTVMWKGRSVKL
jgi:chlorobactene glucosyltransferase